MRNADDLAFSILLIGTTKNPERKEGADFFMLTVYLGTETTQKQEIVWPAESAPMA